jgi:hypothetical protein
MIRAYLAAAGLAAFVLVTPLVAGAAPEDNRFSGTISPSLARPPATGTYVISITNHPQSQDEGTHATISIPDTFDIDDAISPPTPSGCGAANPWSVSIDGRTIDLVAPAGEGLCQQGTLAVTLTVLAAPSADGPYTWPTMLTGASGSFTSLSQPTLLIDGTPPTTVIDPSYPLTTGATASFSFTSSDGPGSGVASLQCRLVGLDERAGPCATPTTMNFSGLQSGQHTFEVAATDVAGNVGTASATWVVDATPPPSPAIISAPASPSGSPTAQFEVQDGEPAVLWCQLDGGAFSNCSSGPSSGAASYSNLSDGAHTFGVKALDGVGNQSGVTTFIWVVDTAHPLVTITDKPSVLTNRVTASFGFAANHPGSTFECRLDDGSFASCTSPKLYNNLGNGSHTFAVRAISLGNPGIPTTYTWTIDTVPPQTAITSTPPALSKSGSANFTFTSSESASSFSCALNTAGFTPCASPKTYAGLGDGSYTFRVEAVDAAGNADSSAATYTWTITGVGKGTADISPPHNVTRLRRNVSYGRLQLRWRKPPDADFDHVGVFVSTSAKTPPRTLIYSGRSQTYTNKRFKNGLYYRYRVVSYDHATNASRGNYKVVPPSVLLESPRDGRVLRSPPVLRWSAVRKATFYNVQVYYRGQKVLSAWPKKPRRALARRWVYSGRGFSLRKGRYAWFVWPGFGPKAKSHYGQLLGQGTFKVR